MSKLTKEKGGKHDKTPNLEEPSFAVIVCFEIEATYTPC